MKCWNLERVINAELLGLRRPNHDLTLDELLKEMEEDVANIGKEVGEVVKLDDEWVVGMGVI